jgi:hypothetical protein
MIVGKILVVLGMLTLLMSASASLVALVTYLRREDASLFGLGYARFYNDEMRRTRPRLFAASFGGTLVGIALCAAGFAFR